MKTHLTVLLLLVASLTAMGRPTLRHLTITDGLPNNQVRQIVELPNHQMLVVAEGFFSLYNGRRFMTLECNLDSVRPLPTFGGETCLWQGDSLLWLKDYYSLYLFDARTRRFRYDYDKHKRTPQLARFIAEHTDSTALHRRTYLAQYQSSLDSLLRSSDLQHDFISAYCRDYQGGEWYGMRSNGILYRAPQKSRIRTIALDVSDEPRRMILLDNRRILLAGSLGLYVFDSEKNAITQTLTQGWFNTADLHRDSQGRVWASTNQGLLCYHHGHVEFFDTTNVRGFDAQFMRFALPIDERRLLVCNNMHSLGYFYPEERRMKLLNKRLPSLENYRTMIVATQLMNRNHVAVCTQNGLFVLDVMQDSIVPAPLIEQAAHFSRKYNCILLDRTGRLWVGTQNGLLLLTTNSLQRITQADGLSNNCIQALAEDPHGNIWVATSDGANRIRTDQHTKALHIRSLTTDDGLPDVEMMERGICILPDGTLYLVTTLGLIAIPTADYIAPPQAPALTLVGLNVAGEDMPLDFLPLRLSHRQNYIDLQVSTLDYAHPRATRYRYRLLEQKGEWQTPLSEDGGLAVIRLSALPPGRYTVEIQASVGDDVWGETMQKTFIIAPPLWLSWWAKALYLLSALALLSVLIHIYIRYRRRKLERENEARVNRLFELREEARHQFAKSVDVTSDGDATTIEADLMIQRVQKSIAENMDNADYTIELLARDVGMSRANLYKKMQARLGITPNDFMRNVRLKHAARLLAETSLPINQIALMVGFQTPRYFSQCFRDIFGVTPSEYRSGRPVVT